MVFKLWEPLRLGHRAGEYPLPPHVCSSRGAAAARREVVKAEVEVDVELITGQGHPVSPTGDELRDPGVHNRHLPLRVSRSVRRARAAAGEPVVPGKPGGLVEHGLARQIPLAHRGAANDQNESAAVSRGIADMAEPCHQTLTREMLHSLILAGLWRLGE